LFIPLTKFFETLRSVYPPDRLLTSSASLAAFKSDGLTAFEALPLAIVVPKTEQEIVETLKLCQQQNVPFVARGSGTSLSGGSLPHRDGIVIALNRLNKILCVDPDRRIAIVQPGVINLDVTRAVERFGLYYAPDPSSQQVCTIGGNLAFNSGGAHCLKYGMTTNHVLGSRIVLADGEVVTLGSESLESDGPDWIGLFCGSEGLMGIATEITLRCLTKPEAFHTVLAGYDTIEMAGDAVARIIAAGFDIPKLMVGSWGELGILYEITLKVFPRPSNYCTVRMETSDIDDAITQLHRLTRSPLDIDGLDLVGSRSLLVRLGGLPDGTVKC